MIQVNDEIIKNDESHNAEKNNYPNKWQFYQTSQENDNLRKRKKKRQHDEKGQSHNNIQKLTRHAIFSWTTKFYQASQENDVSLKRTHREKHHENNINPLGIIVLENNKQKTEEKDNFL